MSELYLVQFRGEVLPAHPLYWEAGVTGYTVMLFAADETDAEARAREFVRLAHFHPSAVTARQLVPKPYTDKVFPPWAKMILNTGVACTAVHLETGADAPEES